jgi:hypothetical protein
VCAPGLGQRVAHLIAHATNGTSETRTLWQAGVDTTRIAWLSNLSGSWSPSAWWSSTIDSEPNRQHRSMTAVLAPGMGQGYQGQAPPCPRPLTPPASRPCTGDRRMRLRKRPRRRDGFGFTTVMATCRPAPNLDLRLRKAGNWTGSLCARPPALDAKVQQETAATNARPGGSECADYSRLGASEAQRDPLPHFASKG